MFKNISDFIYHLRLLTKIGATHQDIKDLANDLWGAINDIDTTTDQHNNQLKAQRTLINNLETNQRNLAANDTVTRNLNTALDKRLTALEGKLAALQQGINDLAVVQAEHHETLTTLKGESK